MAGKQYTEKDDPQRWMPAPKGTWPFWKALKRFYRPYDHDRDAFTRDTVRLRDGCQPGRPEW